MGSHKQLTFRPVEKGRGFSQLFAAFVQELLELSPPIQTTVHYHITIYITYFTTKSSFQLLLVKARPPDQSTTPGKAIKKVWFMSTSITRYFSSALPGKM